MLISHHVNLRAILELPSSQGVSAKAGNPNQFQLGLSLLAILELYSTEAQCRAALFQHRWPKGGECPESGNTPSC